MALTIALTKGAGQPGFYVAYREFLSCHINRRGGHKESGWEPSPRDNPAQSPHPGEVIFSTRLSA